MNSTEITNMYGGKVRVRVCGLLANEEAILLVRHSGINNGSDLWIPPGGGVEFGEHLSEALKREFSEETGLIVEVGDFQAGFEFVQPPLHAIELFFWVHSDSTKIPALGVDPELTEPIIQELRFVTFEELTLMPKESKHTILQNIHDYNDLLNLTSGFKI